MERRICEVSKLKKFINKAIFVMLENLENTKYLQNFGN